MSELLRLIENEVQIAALLFMALVYTIRLIWLFRFKSRKEKTYPAGDARAGITYSMMNIAMPWAMESTRKKPGFYAQFVIFHLGVAAAIGATFIIPYWPDLFKVQPVVLSFQILCGSAFVVGLIRLWRRISNPALKLISTADDFFSLILMIVYFALSVLAIPNVGQPREWPLVAFFLLTAFLLVYVPFSKICHYLYYPFTRFFLGRSLGHRGTISKKTTSKSGTLRGETSKAGSTLETNIAGSPD